MRPDGRPAQTRRYTARKYGLRFSSSQSPPPEKNTLLSAACETPRAPRPRPAEVGTRPSCFESARPAREEGTPARRERRKMTNSLERAELQWSGSTCGFDETSPCSSSLSRMPLRLPSRAHLAWRDAQCCCCCCLFNAGAEAWTRGWPSKLDGSRGRCRGLVGCARSRTEGCACSVVACRGLERANSVRARACSPGDI